MGVCGCDFIINLSSTLIIFIVFDTSGNFPAGYCSSSVPLFMDDVKQVFLTVELSPHLLAVLYLILENTKSIFAWKNLAS